MFPGLGLVRNLPCLERSEINADIPNAFLIGGDVIPAAPWCLVRQKKCVAACEGGVWRAHEQFWDVSPLSDAGVSGRAQMSKWQMSETEEPVECPNAMLAMP